MMQTIKGQDWTYLLAWGKLLCSTLIGPLIFWKSEKANEPTLDSNDYFTIVR